MKRFDWGYLRKNCLTCARAEEYLAEAELEPRERVDARKQPLVGDEALAFVRKSISQLFATRGKKVVHVDLAKQKPSDDELRKLVVGPLGNLRAPALRRGKTLIIGFDKSMYDENFGPK